MTLSGPVHVAAAAVFDTSGRVLIARRPEHLHQGGLWEFPGGKVESGETVELALQRELHEEVGIKVVSARPLIRIFHDYPDKSVVLDVWRVDDHHGEAHGREGQPCEWVLPDELDRFEFPAANRPIITAVRLPQAYLITPEPGPDHAVFLEQLQQALAAGIRLVQFRANSLPAEVYKQLAAEVISRCRSHAAKVLLNAPAEWVVELCADGVHLSVKALRELSQRPLAKHYWVAASCHSPLELQQAADLGVDFAVLGPVTNTASHPGVVPLGWAAFQTLAERAAFPVFALGGLTSSDLHVAVAHGAQGIAAIRGLWPTPKT